MPQALQPLDTTRPLADLGLTIAGTRLQPIIDRFLTELTEAGITQVRPHFYLSTEWGVPWGTISIAIPFYLARPDLTSLHAERSGFVEGISDRDILRYLRHEMGHVVNYAYRLFEESEWVERFGAITQPYEEEYRPKPFSRHFVRHLPGWYAQKHPDEDWSETFAVWMTPGIDWRSQYSGWPIALAKLDYCDRRMRELAAAPPKVQTIDHDEDVAGVMVTLEDYYRTKSDTDLLPPGLDGALLSIFEDLGAPEDATSVAPRLPAGKLIRRHANTLAATVFRWTGHFPERTRPLVRGLARRADELKQVYPADREIEVLIALTSLVTALAMNYVVQGAYFGPSSDITGAASAGEP
jgi:hypothetical protein